MPVWMHERAEHILSKNPSMPKGEAFAIATLQSHALGKSPKGFGTAEGKHVAKEKYKTPGDDSKVASAFLEELAAIKQAFSTNEYSGPMGSVPFKQHSHIPPFKAPSLEKPVEKVSMMTPAGQLASSQRKGTGFGKSPSGPSIAEVAKPLHMGQSMPGALKNQI